MKVHQMWQEDLLPFQLYGKLWHVGGRSSPSYLFDTGDGLLLLDTGLPKSGYILFRNIYDLGFKPRDIRWILHSHGHYDHIGMTRALVEMTGAKTYIKAKCYVSSLLRDTFIALLLPQSTLWSGT